MAVGYFLINRLLTMTNIGLDCHIFVLLPPDIVAESIVFLGCSVCPSVLSFVRPFVRSVIVSMISHERLE